jgi:SAM-dependent methyltransferase
VSDENTGGLPHWEAVYGARQEAALTWFEGEPELSLALIAAYGAPDEAVIDVGGGASRLIDALLARGYGAVSCLDLAPAALAASRARLGPEAAARVCWIAADVTEWMPEPGRYGIWHDRAAFHFLTEADARAAYVARMARGVKPGGHAILMTFAEDGPEMCSGLPVRRYAPEGLAAEIARHAPGVFTLVEGRRHLHRTPKGAVQAFQATVLRRG